VDYIGVFPLGHLGYARPLELREISVMAKNATLEKLPRCKITQIIATRCQILRLKCTKFDFGFSTAPDPAGEWRAYSAPPDHLWVPLLREGEGEREKKGGKGEEREEMYTPFSNC